MGAAPGVGKTYDMLAEGHRRLGRGADVVVGFVETHGRAHTAAMVEGLEVVPRQLVEHRGASFTEMDLAAVLARHPQVALVDELAHTNVPGAGNAKRWQDVHALLDAGIDVITTVNIQHLESLNDVVESITGIRQQETVPDERGPRRGPDRAGGHEPAGAAPPPGPRQRVQRREDRRRPVELLPRRQPDRAARAGAALGRRPGGRRPGALPRRQRDHRHVAGPGARGGRADRRSGGRDPDPPRAPGSPTPGPAATSSPCTSASATAWPTAPPTPCSASAPWWNRWAAPSTTSWARTSPTRSWSSPAGSTRATS